MLLCRLIKGTPTQKGNYKLKKSVSCILSKEVTKRKLKQTPSYPVILYIHKILIVAVFPLTKQMPICSKPGSIWVVLKKDPFIISSLPPFSGLSRDEGAYAFFPVLAIGTKSKIVLASGIKFLIISLSIYVYEDLFASELSQSFRISDIR